MNPPESQTHSLAARVDSDVSQCLSALVDGQADALAPGCEHWRSDTQARKTWHAYHLIGDVMRSEELAAGAPSDADFLAAVRARLATEPVILSPEPPASARAVRRGAWLAPLAMAAGVAAVAGVLVVARIGLPGAQPAGPAQSLAGASAPGLTLATVPAATLAPTPQGAGVIRDAHLDSYLRAHQAGRGDGAAAVPGGVLRSVDVMLPPGTPR